MKIGNVSFLSTTLVFTFGLVMPTGSRTPRDSSDFLFFLITVILFNLILIFGFGQVFHFKKEKLIVWYFNPFKKSIQIPYESIKKVEIFRGVSSMIINYFRFKTITGEIIINNNIFFGWELKKIKKHFEKLNIDCEL